MMAELTGSVTDESSTRLEGAEPQIDEHISWEACAITRGFFGAAIEEKTGIGRYFDLPQSPFDSASVASAQESSHAQQSDGAYRPGDKSAIAHTSKAHHEVSQTTAEARGDASGAAFDKALVGLSAAQALLDRWVDSGTFTLLSEIDTRQE